MTSDGAREESVPAPLTRVHTAMLKSGIQPSCAPQKLGAESTDAKFFSASSP
jgi:hypothetical protein